MRRTSGQLHGLAYHAAILLALTVVPRIATAQTTAIPDATDSEIAALAQQLSDPVYEKRVGATRRLCRIGQPAMEMLRRASDGADVEASLRARKVIQALERVWFAGIEVRLESDRTSFAWDEPVELRIVLENRSRFAARVPFQTGTDQSEGESVDASQVAPHMIDASDWLVVQSAQGREIDLRVDEISDDPSVLRVIRERLASGPVSDLAPGERVTVRVAAFNRGWARYPLLNEGHYTVALQYVPEWVDPVLAEEKVGEVRSNTLALHVTVGAPEAVSRSGAHADVSIRRDDSELVASITNRTDRAMLINTNYGVAVPFAEIQWVYEREGRRAAINAAAAPGRNWVDFDPVRFIPLEPGGSLELARAKVAELSRALNQAGETVVAGEGTVALSYLNLCDRQWQIREQANLDKDAAAPEVFRKALPRELLSTRLISPSLRSWSAP